jgi:putative addiction module killer protein
MIEVRQTERFQQWHADLKDRQAQARITARIRRLEEGNPGQHRVLKGGVCEMKIDYRPGYRVYYTRRGEALVILLCGGDKRRQQQDIETATVMAKEV